MLLLGDATGTRQPIVLTEFGGIALASKKGDWGYSKSDTPKNLLELYDALLETVRALPALAGFCYTQFTDTYQEANGLLFADRTPKASLDEIALATTGLRPDQDSRSELVWRERLMDMQRRSMEIGKVHGGD